MSEKPFGVNKMTEAILAVAIAAAVPAVASAGLVLKLESGFALPVTVLDNGVGDADPAVGRITNISTIGDFSTVISVGTSNSPGTDVGLLQIQSLDVRNFAAGQATLKITLSDTNFTLPPGPAMVLSSSIGGTLFRAAAGDTVTFESFADPANGQPAAAVTTGVQSYVAIGTGFVPESFNSNTSTNWVRGGGAYSLANISTITISPGAQANFSATTSAVPEPGVLGLAAVAAAGLLARRRRA